MQVKRTSIKAWMGKNFGRIPLLTAELAALEKSMYNLVITLAPSFLIASSSLLQVRKTITISKMSSKFGLIRSQTAELAALEHLQKFP